MIKTLLLLLPIFGFSNNIILEHAQIKPLGKVIQTNAQITQLSDQKQEVVSRLSGHVEKYFVKAGRKVKEGDKVEVSLYVKLAKDDCLKVIDLKDSTLNKPILMKKYELVL